MLGGYSNRDQKANISTTKEKPKSFELQRERILHTFGLGHIVPPAGPC